MRVHLSERKLECLEGIEEDLDAIFNDEMYNRLAKLSILDLIEVGVGLRELKKDIITQYKTLTED